MRGSVLNGQTMTIGGRLPHLLGDRAKAAQHGGDVGGRRARQQHVSDRVVDHLLALQRSF